MPLTLGKHSFQVLATSVGLLNAGRLKRRETILVIGVPVPQDYTQSGWIILFSVLTVSPSDWCFRYETLNLFSVLRTGTHALKKNYTEALTIDKLDLEIS